MMTVSYDKPPPRKRMLTAEEKKLWKQVTRHDRPLPHHAAADGRPVADDRKEEILSRPPGPPVKPRPVSRQPSTASPLIPGAYAGIDRNTVQRFRKGDYPFDATLDLHGMSRDRAHAALADFIRGHWERGSRCLLVVTGKGLRAGGPGVLREMLPGWLAAPGMRDMVLALDMARPRHGGQGAYYILLRRRR